MYCFVINLEVGAPEEIFPVWSTPNVGEDVAEGKRSYTRIGIVASLRRDESVRAQCDEALITRQMEENMGANKDCNLPT
jgi:hypothetical protein